MADRSSDRDGSASEPRGGSRPRWPFASLFCAALLGAAGVLVGAAGTHRGGGDLARTASEFLLIHAAVIVGASGVALSSRAGARSLAVALVLLTAGAVLFSADLALAGFYDWRPVPLAAPVGGLCLIAGWLGIALSAALAGLVKR